jgi:hypothetical protein
LPTTLCTTLDSANPVLYPSIDTILIKLCVLLTMPVVHAIILERGRGFVIFILRDAKWYDLGPFQGFI